MSLNKDIQQTEFRTEYQKAIINIMYTYNYLIAHMAGVFKEFDITRQQYNVLRILRGQYPNHGTVNLIKDRMLDKMSDTSRIVERLRIKNLVSRTENSLDKRVVEIHITEAGLDLLERMEGPIQELEQGMYGLTEGETILLNSLLDKLRTGVIENIVEEPEIELLHQPEKF